jgi:hypothetical protein
MNEFLNSNKITNKKDMIDLLSSMLGFKWRIKDENELMKLRKLETLDLEGIAKYLKTCKNIIFMTGAGISTGKIRIIHIFE